MSSYYFYGQTGPAITGSTGAFTGNVTVGGTLGVTGVSLFAAGTAGAPGVGVGGATDGLFRASAGIMGLTGTGVEVARFSATLAQIPAASVLSWNGRAQITSPADSQVQFLSAGAGTGMSLILGNTAGAGVTLSHSGNILQVQTSPGGTYGTAYGGSFETQQGLGGFKTTSSNGALGIFTSVSGTATAMSGATATISNLIPAGAMVVGVALRVTTLITSGAGTAFTIGDGSTADRYGTGIAFTAGTTTNNTNWTVTSPLLYTAATSVVLTCAGGTFTAGAVRVTVTYLTCSAPSS